MQTKELSLTKNEILFIDDSLSLMIDVDVSGERIITTTIRPLNRSAKIPTTTTFLKKIGLAIIDMNKSENEEMTIDVSTDDLYRLREIAHSDVKIKNEFVGFNLKRKIANLLFQEDKERYKSVKKLLSQLPINDKKNRE